MDMTKAKFRSRTKQEAISNAIRTHNIKGKFANTMERAAEDVAVFEYLGLKLHASSQMLFPKSLYQAIRTQLIAFQDKYKCLAEVTLDRCKGILTIEGTAPNRIILHKGIVVAQESKKKVQPHIKSDFNSYLFAKEGI